MRLSTGQGNRKLDLAGVVRRKIYKKKNIMHVIVSELQLNLGRASKELSICIVHHRFFLITYHQKSYILKKLV